MSFSSSIDFIISDSSSIGPDYRGTTSKQSNPSFSLFISVLKSNNNLPGTFDEFFIVTKLLF